MKRGIVLLTLLVLGGAAWAQSLTPEQTKALVAFSDGTTTTPSGLRYKILTPGTGDKPQKGQMVSATYTGRLLDGTVFDTTDKQPIGVFQFTVGSGQVIAGWDEAFLDMKKHEKRLIIVPPALGYGDKAVGPIPPNSWLVFEVELVGIRG
jgi:peptidylprolyl isomerase